MDFLQQQEKIKQFIEDIYPIYLDEYNINEPEVTTDMLDFDLHKRDFTLFIDFNKINFGNTRFDDDCALIEKLQIDIFLVVRNDKVSNLKQKILEATSAFYKMIRIKNDFEFALRTNIDELNFYNFAATGTQFIMIANFSLTLEIEG